MSNRKLQKDIDIIFKKIQEGLHEFNYHYDRYESINTDENSDNQREKEKLENDLKKEIKRLQKFREQIKIWQLNDVLKTLNSASSALSNRLNENKKLIEEAMEVYKDVERSSKLKTFSNQSILMAAREQNRDDDEDDSSDYWDDDFDNGTSDDEENEEDADDGLELSPESREGITLLKKMLVDIRDQLKKFEAEFEKLTHKKIRKNNITIIESKKEKIKLTLDQNKFHTKKILKLIKLLMASNIIDINLIRILQDDIQAHLDSGSESAPSNDTSLYDDIFNLITGDDNDYSNVDDSEIFSTPKKSMPDIQIANPSSITINTSTVLDHPFKNPVHTQPVSAVDNSHIPSSPLPRRMASPEMSSPAIIKILKPASTPSKPVGGLKWSTAAAAGVPEPELKESSFNKRSDSPESSILSHMTQTNSNTSAGSPAVSKTMIAPDHPDYKYVEVLKNSGLSNIEFNLFSDTKLVKLPPGIQDLIISFTSKRNYSHDFALLYDSNEYNQFVTPINKPYLPSSIQNLSSQSTGKNQFKPPMQLFKFQSYWNKVRAQEQFEQYAHEIRNQLSLDNSAIANELVLVLFYGYYYGLTPLENVIAEWYLYQLGWKPYKSNSALLANQTNNIQAIKSVDLGNSSTTCSQWFRCVKLLSESAEFDFGDFQVFDLTAWEIFTQFGFKFEHKLSQSEPSRSLFH